MASAKQDQAAPIVEQAVEKQKAGDLQGAITLYQQALQLIPNNARTWTNLATAQQQADNFQQARDSYQKGYNIDKKGEVGNLYLMGLIDENYGKGSQALSLYNQYLKAAPTGDYVQLANERVAALTKNVNDTQKLLTSTEQKSLAAADEAYQEGMKQQQASSYDEALASYQKAVQANPQEPAYPYAIGTVYQAKGDMDNAIANYQKAISLSKDKTQVAEIQKVLDSAKGAQAAPLVDEANKAYASQDYATAVGKYQEALKITPNDADIYTYLGASYQYQGNFDQARAAYDKGFQIGGKAKAENLYFIGLLDENANNAAGAIADYQKYMQLAPQGPYKAQAQSRVDALRKDPGSVQKIVTAAEQKQNEAAQGAYNNAVTLQQSEKYDEALAEYNKAIEASPGDASYYYSRGTCYQAKGDLDSALKDYDKAISINPNEQSFKDAANGVRSAQAGPLLESAYKKQTTDLGGGKYDYAGAIADYMAALRIWDDPGSRMNLGTAYQASGDLQGALREYSSAIGKDGKLADAYYYRGTVYEELKNPAGAKRDYQKYLQLAPTGPNAADAKERLKALGGAGGAPARRRHR